MSIPRIAIAAALFLCVGAPVAMNHAPVFAQDSPWRIKKIAFEAQRRDLSGTHIDLYVMDATDTKPKRLAEGTSPTWSPDGKKLAYCIHGAHDDLQIMVADGTAKRQLTDMKGGACPPVWSPDSRSIAFTSNGAGPGMIWVVGADGENPRAVLEGDIAGWSPDAKKLLFHRREAKGGDNGWIANADGSEPQVVFKENANVISMAWFPDGKSVVYSSDRAASKPAIFRVDVDGTHLEQFVSGNYMSRFSPVLSPDGKWFVVDAVETDGARSLTFETGGKVRKEWLYGRHASIVWEKK